MARTTMATVDALRKQQWESVQYRDTLLESYFMGRFGGEASQKLMQGVAMPSEGDYQLSSPSDLIDVRINLKKQAGSKFYVSSLTK